MADAKTEKQKVQEITEKLEQGIKELFESEKYKTYLNTMSKFHNYSFNNTMLIAMPTDFSFPSGHTMVSFAAATVLWHWNRKVGIAAYLFAAIIAFSRLYLFVHFPSDVFAGAVIGILIGIAAIKGTDWMQKKFQKQKN